MINIEKIGDVFMFFKKHRGHLQNPHRNCSLEFGLQRVRRNLKFERVRNPNEMWELELARVNEEVEI